MKKKYIVVMLAVLTVGLISWGGTGHKTVAKIAENHLTPAAQLAVKALLGEQRMADVASWADGLRNDPNYSNTSSWHYINAPLGLSFADFSKTVKDQGATNVYGALLKCEDDIKSKGTTFQQKADALKFIIHFVGDIHQPMHVSRAEDKGGNSIQMQFNGKGTNLHSLWDSGLINKQGETFEQMAVGYDRATPEEIKDWQGTDPMRWAYESYEIAAKIYAEADQDKSPGDVYFQTYIPIVQERIEKAGIRLAGILNELFKDTKITSVVAMPPPPAKPVQIEDIAKHLNEDVRVTAKVYGMKDLGSMVLVNLGAAYPDSPLTVVLRGDAKPLAAQVDGKIITVTGKVIEYKGKPEIIVTEAAHIMIN